MIGCFALGLSVFLYYPLRSPSAPFGPTDITSLESFIHFVSAEGLRVNLFYYGLSDQLTRFGVFFELLKLQYSIVGIVLVIPGVIWLARTGVEAVCVVRGVLPVAVPLHHQHRAGCDGVPDAALHDDCGLQRIGRVGDGDV